MHKVKEASGPVQINIEDPQQVIPAGLMPVPAYRIEKVGDNDI